MIKVLVMLVILILFDMFLDVNTVFAHTPHHVIEALEISPVYHLMKVLFIIVKNKVLLKSVDGGFSWKRLENGIDNEQDTLSSVAVSPHFHHDSTVFLSSEAEGIFKSINGGLSWFKVNNGLSNLNISFLSSSFNFQYDKSVLAAGSNGGLYKTKNGGDVWYQVIDKSVKLTSIAFIPDSANNSIIIGDKKGIIYISHDIGEKWQRLFHLQNCGAITSIAVSSDRTFFIGTQRNGVYKTIDGGVSFRDSNNGISDPYITSIALSPEYKRDSTIFTVTWNDAMFKSEDDGENWKMYNKGLTKDPQADASSLIIYQLPHFSHLKVSKNYSNDKTIFIGGFDGLFKSTNGGDDWLQLETKPIKLIKGLSISPAYNTNYTIAITTYGGGAYTSSDKGATWLINNRGLHTTRLSDIVFSPNYHSNSTMFSSAIDCFLISDDKESRWTYIKQNRCLSIDGPDTRKVNKARIRRMLTKWFSQRYIQKSRDKIWPSVIAVSPAFASDNTVFFGSRRQGVFRSNDGGLNFSLVWDSMGEKITTIVISPDFSSDKTLFVGARRGKGIWKSVDGGNRWKSINKGITLIKNIYLAISPNYKVDKTLFAATENGLFKTIDGGVNWRKISSEIYGKDGIVVALGISPSYSKDRTLVISVKGRGLFKTDDGGVNWIEIGSELINNNYSLEFIEFSPIYSVDNTIYGASDEELVKSTDAGNTWEVIKRPVRYENVRKYENMRNVIHYEGEWKVVDGNDFSTMSISCSDVVNSRATLNFVGSGISWIGTKSNELGIAKVYIDGVFKDYVDQFSIGRKVMEELFTLKGLSLGHHTIMIEVTNNKNPESSGNRIEIDAFDVI